MTFDPKEVLYFGTALERLASKVDDAANMAYTKALPGSRRFILRPLDDAKALIQGLQELTERAGLSKRLGFVVTASGIQPVVTPEGPKDPTEDPKMDVGPA